MASVSKYLREIWNAKDLRKKILFTLFAIVIYRFVSHITVPNVDITALQTIFNRNAALGFFNALLGGSMENFSIVLMGLSPYINASIIIQLLTVMVPKLEALSKEGEQGSKKINQYTRFLTVPLAFLQSYGMILLLNQLSGGTPVVSNVGDFGTIFPIMMTITAGTLFLLWLGDLITEKGIGNGISVLIFSGIVASIPQVIGQTISLANVDEQKIISAAIMVVVTIVLTAFIIWFTEGYRIIPIAYAGRGTRGSSEQSNLPIRVNQAGMVPIIFSISLITFPSILANLFQNTQSEILRNISQFMLMHFNPQNPTWYYVVVYALLTIGFSYFYVSITFKPDTIAENIQKRGGFVPGMRPGKQTAEFLGQVSSHLTLFGGIFLTFVAVSPYVLDALFSGLGTGAVPLLMSGAGLIIVVGVVLEIIRKINASLVMHEYDKFY